MKYKIDLFNTTTKRHFVFRCSYTHSVTTNERTDRRTDGWTTILIVTLPWPEIENLTPAMDSPYLKTH